MQFVQPDTLIPGFANPQSWNRYSYSNNNPLYYTDPSGHMYCDFINNQNREDCTSGQERFSSERGLSGGSSLPSTPTRSSSPSAGVGSGGSGRNQNNDTNSLGSYQKGWQNFSSAWSIFNNPKAGWGNWAISGAYLALWGGAHAGLAIGAGGLACAASGPGCVAAVEGVLGIGAGGVSTYTRYMSGGELNAINNTSFLRGGNPGDTFFTTDIYTTVSEAQQALSLKTPPQYGVTFQILNDPIINGPQAIWPKFFQPGGGIEYWTTSPVLVRIIEVLELK